MSEIGDVRDSALSCPSASLRGLQCGVSVSPQPGSQGLGLEESSHVRGSGFPVLERTVP